MKARIGAAFVSAGVMACTGQAEAQDWSLSYTADLTGAVSGGAVQRVRFLDAVDAVGDFDLERVARSLTGWTAHLFIENTSGGTPNSDIGTLQGVDNIEVDRQRLRLYEAWAERAWGDASLRFGLYDLNSEFYATDAASLLLAPSFGIGPEAAGTGPNGPSIFPSTALAVRLNYQFSDEAYARVAVLNARAGVPGDPGGVDTSFDDGVLVIGEGGYHGLALGAWTYSKDQPDVRDGSDTQAHGAYAMYARPLNDASGVRAMTGFLRVGASDGDSSEIRASWQSGVLVERVLASRPASALSFGVAQAFLSSGYRANQRDSGIDSAPNETQFELTYSDALCPHVSVQPDLQYVIDPGGDRNIDDAVVTALRVTVTL